MFTYFSRHARLTSNLIFSQHYLLVAIFMHTQNAVLSFVYTNFIADSIKTIFLLIINSIPIIKKFLRKSTLEFCQKIPC
jgi:hypothetical protein